METGQSKKINKLKYGFGSHEVVFQDPHWGLSLKCIFYISGCDTRSHATSSLTRGNAITIGWKKRQTLCSQVIKEDNESNRSRQLTTVNKSRKQTSFSSFKSRFYEKWQFFSLFNGNKSQLVLCHRFSIIGFVLWKTVTEMQRQTLPPAAQQVVCSWHVTRLIGSCV